MRSLTILMPMGGLGKRFSDAGFIQPKPIISVDGMPMFKKALTSLDNIPIAKKIVFVIRKDSAEKYNLDKLIKDAEPAAQVIVIPDLTRGAAETAYKAKEILDPNSGLVVLDCDLWFTSQNYTKMIIDSLSGISDISGLLLTFKSDKPIYSYAEIDKNGTVLRTAEKQVISPDAVTGSYYFAFVKDFISACEELFLTPISDIQKEYYMSNLFNIMLVHHKIIRAAGVDKYYSFGTPVELESYNSRKR